MRHSLTQTKIKELSILCLIDNSDCSFHFLGLSIASVKLLPYWPTLKITYHRPFFLIVQDC
uniref:Uncharacterized protein n=1 Tax=Arundo donax TaxID=35708 RepID=A0A0A8YKA2_ARUDO